MHLVHTLHEFGHSGQESNPDPVTDWYTGICPQTKQAVQLPRTQGAEAIARGLMHQLQTQTDRGLEGKMYGVLLVETPTGGVGVLKAFSGLWSGQADVEGWVPPISGRDRLVLAEAQTLAELNAIAREILRLQHLPLRHAYKALAQTWAETLQSLTLVHAQRKHQRHQQRLYCLETLTGTALDQSLAQLNQASQQDGIERKLQKRDRDQQLHPLQVQIAEADRQTQALKQRRKRLSQRLQAQMHAVYSLTNFAGASLSLEQLMGGGIPTGSGECCAPKLLHYAATHHLRPIALAEFWWGPPSANGDRIPGNFYGACVERCQPLMGFLLSGLTQPAPPQVGDFAILYTDPWLIAVHKPSGLLSVPGRRSDRQDSVLTRLRSQFPENPTMLPAHRLDQDTSGVLLFARDADTHRHLSRQFQQRQVDKVYEAVLAGPLHQERGVIDLPLWGDPQRRPYQAVDWQRGKPSSTQFQVLTRDAVSTRLEFRPLTGRTHQLRVHAASPEGLGVAILGDRLYGKASGAERLHLHARELRLQHPQSGQPVVLQAASPF